MPIRSLRSLRKRIQEHEAKLRAEQAQAQPDIGLIVYWQKEIMGHRKVLARVERRLLPARRRRRGTRR